MSEEDFPEELNKDMQEAAYRIAIEYVAQTFTHLRNSGLSRRDAAIIVAAMIQSREDEFNNEQD